MVQYMQQGVWGRTYLTNMIVGNEVWDTQGLDDVPNTCLMVKYLDWVHMFYKANNLVLSVI